MTHLRLLYTLTKEYQLFLDCVSNIRGIGFVKTYFFGKISFDMFDQKLDFGRATINMLVLKMLSNISIYKFVNAFQIIWCVAGRSSPSINISIVRKCPEVSLSATWSV